MRPPKLTRIEFKERLYRRRYLVPNAVTLANLFCGFLTIIYASSFRFEKAAIAIGIAILLDGLDGRVARKLNATSKFGVEFDSFSDLVSFGLGPAMLMYHWCFKVQADEFGVFICFVYAICAASRLARFNISDSNLDGFSGLPTPGAAAVVAAVVNFAPRVEPTFLLLTFGTSVMPLLSYLMVSQIEFKSVKKARITGTRVFTLIGLAAIIGLIWYKTQIGFLALAFGYCISGPAKGFWMRFRAAAPRSDQRVA